MHWTVECGCRRWGGNIITGCLTLSWVSTPGPVSRSSHTHSWNALRCRTPPDFTLVTNAASRCGSHDVSNVINQVQLLKSETIFNCNFPTALVRLEDTGVCRHLTSLHNKHVCSRETGLSLKWGFTHSHNPVCSTINNNLDTVQHFSQSFTFGLREYLGNYHCEDGPGWRCSPGVHHHHSQAATVDDFWCIL